MVEGISSGRDMGFVCEDLCRRGDEENWEALLETLRLMRQVGTALAASLGYAYPLEDDQRMTAYLLRVRALPADAVSYDD